MTAVQSYPEARQWFLDRYRGRWRGVEAHYEVIDRLVLERAPNQQIEPTAWSTLRPKHGIMMTVEPH